jgi:hypothetical protein
VADNTITLNAGETHTMRAEMGCEI